MPISKSKLCHSCLNMNLEFTGDDGPFSFTVNEFLDSGTTAMEESMPGSSSNALYSFLITQGGCLDCLLAVREDFEAKLGSEMLSSAEEELQEIPEARKRIEELSEYISTKNKAKTNIAAAAQAAHQQLKAKKAEKPIQTTLTQEHLDKAKQGDREAVQILRNAVNSGDITALHKMVALFSMFNIQKNDEEVLNCYKELAYEHKDPMGMIELGAIYCGDSANNNIQQFPGLKSFYNPKEGFRLIEEGIKLAEAKGDDNPLRITHYDKAFGAYHADTQKMYRPEERGTPYHSEEGGGGSVVGALTRKIELVEKAIEILKKNPSYVPSDSIEDELNFYEKILSNSKGELEAVKGAADSYNKAVETVSKVIAADIGSNTPKVKTEGSSQKEPEDTPPVTESAVTTLTQEHLDKAKQGDREAVQILRNAYAAGDTHALHKMAALFSMFQIQENDEEVLECFKTLAHKHKDPIGMIELGYIYSGSDMNNNIKNFPGLKAHYNPKEAFRLIEEGIKLAEADSSGKPLLHIYYHKAADAYHSDTRKNNNRDELGIPHHSKEGGGGTIKGALARTIELTEKAIESLKIDSSYVPGGSFEDMMNLYENILNSKRKELEAYKGIEDNYNQAIEFVDDLAKMAEVATDEKVEQSLAYFEDRLKMHENIFFTSGNAFTADKIKDSAQIVAAKERYDIMGGRTHEEGAYKRKKQDYEDNYFIPMTKELTESLESLQGLIKMGYPRDAYLRDMAERHQKCIDHVGELRKVLVEVEREYSKPAYTNPPDTEKRPAESRLSGLSHVEKQLESAAMEPSAERQDSTAAEYAHNEAGKPEPVSSASKPMAVAAIVLAAVFGWQHFFGGGFSWLLALPLIQGRLSLVGGMVRFGIISMAAVLIVWYLVKRESE